MSRMTLTFLDVYIENTLSNQNFGVIRHGIAEQYATFTQTASLDALDILSSSITRKLNDMS